ncbi:MAG: ParB/RepB/Spo0J family partition protein [Flavobacteriales bacterium]|nr:ParB/RepB/Spo0J family partition protein [Flavobacteriales bacterium]
MAKRNALGRGLGALLENYETDITTKNGGGSSNQSPLESEAAVGTVANLPLNNIDANPFQPRSEFDAQALEELSASIQQFSLIQPVTVRKLGYDKYQLICGERRFKAARMAGLESIPAYIRIANDQEMLELALVENIQRQNLNALEIAISYERLTEECNLTQEELSQRVGKNRATVANYLRLLKLPDEIKAAIKKNAIQMGHARALINIEDGEKQLKIFKATIAKGLSVRQVEELAREEGDRKASTQEKVPFTLSNEQKKMAYKLSTLFDSEVEIKRNRDKSGKIVIPFKSDEQFARLASAFEQDI